MEIEIDNKRIQIETELLSVFHQPINVFASGAWDSTKISELKKIEFNLKITIDSDSWNIPYLVLLKKDLKDEFVEEYKDKFIELSSMVGESIDYTFIPSTIDIFQFSKINYINLPYFEIFKEKFDEIAFKVLNFIDTYNISEISKEEYEHIDKSTFFNFSKQRLENITKKEKFVIREYRLQDIEFENIERLKKDHNVNKWQIPNLNYKEVNLQSAKVFRDILLIVVPKNFCSKYRPNFEEINRFISDFNNHKSQIYKNFQGADIFNGSYDECMSLINNSEKLTNLKKEIYRKREKSRLDGISFRDDSDWGGLYGEEAEIGRWNCD